MVQQIGMMYLFSANKQTRTLNVTSKAKPQPNEIIPVVVPPDEELVVSFGKLAKLHTVNIEADVENGHASNPRLAPEYLMTRIGQTEGIGVEFKSSLFFAPGEERPSGKQMQTIAQTIASFMNGEGGSLYFGVDNSGGVRHGLAADYAYLSQGGEGVVVDTPLFTDGDRSYKGDADGYSLKIHAVVRAYLGSAAEANLGDCEETVASGGRPFLKLTVRPAPDDVVVYYPIVTQQGVIDGIFVRNGAAKKSLWGSDRDQFIRERTKRQVLANVNAVVAQNPAGLIEQVLAAINSAFTARPQVVGAAVVVDGAVALDDPNFAAMTSPKGLVFDGQHVSDVKTWKEAFGALLVKLNSIDAAKFDGIAADPFFKKWFIEVQPHKKYGDYFKDKLGTAANVRGYVKVGKIHFARPDYVVQKLLARFDVAPNRVALRG